MFFILIFILIKILKIRRIKLLLSICRWQNRDPDFVILSQWHWNPMARCSVGPRFPNFCFATFSPHGSFSVKTGKNHLAQGWQLDFYLLHVSTLGYLSQLPEAMYYVLLMGKGCCDWLVMSAWAFGGWVRVACTCSTWSSPTLSFNQQRNEL